MTTSSYSSSQMQSSPSEGDRSVDASVICDQDLDVTKRDRFELLSAYLDGEVTPAERQRVLCWLQHDPNTRSLYNRLLALRQGLRSQSPADASCADFTAACVFRSVNRRLRLAAMASAGVAALGLIQVLSGDVGRYGLWRPSVAVQPDSLQVALDQPAFPIPEVVPVSATTPSESSALPIDSDL